MATKATGWLCTHTASIVSQTDTTATIRVTAIWKNSGWRYDINYVNAWVYCNGASKQVATNGSVDTSSDYDSETMGSYDFVIDKGTAEKSISCYAKITSNSSYVSGTKQSSATSVTVPAKPSYTITYNANGGSGAPSAQTKWYGANLVLSSTKPTRTGYSFVRWNTKTDNTGTAYNPGATYSGNAALTLYAIWSANTYTVSYNANGGTGAPANQTKTHGTNLTLSSTKPTRTNYNFLGWSTSANGGVVYASGASYTNNSAITLYAVWELAYVKPRINNFTAQRCTADGVASETGTYIKVIFSWATDDAVTKIAIRHKLQEVSNFTETNVVASGTSGSVSQVIGADSISTESSYHVTAYVSDSTTDGTHATYAPQISIGTVKFPIDVKAGGTGVAIGKVSEKDAFEVGMDVYDKHGQQLSGKNISHYNSETNNIRVISCSPVKTGGVYQVAISFNSNTTGSPLYRTTIYAILTVPCGYNGTDVVVKPHIDELVTYYGSNFDTSHRLSVHVEGGGSEINAWYFNNKVYIYVQCVSGLPTADWAISIRPLVE